MDADSPIGPHAIVRFAPGLRVCPVEGFLPESGPVVRRVNPIPVGVAPDARRPRSFESFGMEGIDRG